MKTFKDFIKDSKKTSQEKQRSSATETNDNTANDSIVKTGLEQSAEIASYQKTEGK